jgi:hypothetical protein
LWILQAQNVTLVRKTKRDGILPRIQQVYNQLLNQRVNLKFKNQMDGSVERPLVNMYLGADGRDREAVSV